MQYGKQPGANLEGIRWPHLRDSKKEAGLAVEASTISESTMEESDSEEEMFRWLKHRKTLKSGKVRTADSMVVKCITWPHELLYTSGGQPGTYEQISMAFMPTNNCHRASIKLLLPS